MTLPERFWKKVDKNGPVPETRPELGACWVWLGAKQSLGYGHWTFEGRWPKAHRSAYEDLVGRIRKDRELDHLCRNRACVNPTHLEQVTHKKNTRRGEAGKYLADRTHCPKGHPYDEANTDWKKRIGRPGKMRRCRACAREYYHRAKAARRVHRAR